MQITLDCQPNPNDFLFKVIPFMSFPYNNYCFICVHLYQYWYLFLILLFVIWFSFTDLRTAFDLLDRDQDGMVTPNELQFMLRNLGIIVSDELIDGLMKEASKTGISQLWAFLLTWNFALLFVFLVVLFVCTTKTIRANFNLSL